MTDSIEDELDSTALKILAHVVRHPEARGALLVIRDAKGKRTVMEAHHTQVVWVESRPQMSLPGGTRQSVKTDAGG